MRIWDVPVFKLYQKHLLGEHHELHIIYNVLIGLSTGWKNHPETKRWTGKLHALALRHDEQIEEFKRRGWKSGINHKTPIKIRTGLKTQDVLLHTVSEQIIILNNKPCNCQIKEE